MVFLVLKGKSEIYRVLGPARGPAENKPMPFDPAVWGPRSATFAQAHICDKVAGEKAPYPSCTQ